MTTKAFVPRTCHACGKPKGTMSFRFTAEDGSAQREYFHPKCFKAWLKTKGGKT